MIRYQLYECNDREVLLKKELHFLGNFIELGLCIDENKMLTLRIENSTHPDQARDAGGIGLQNVQRRLNLVYPGRHRLDIGKEENTFKILLTLELE